MSDQTTPALSVLGRLIDGLRENTRATTVFGPPVTSGGTTVVPVARVGFFGAMGGGVSRATMLGGEGSGGIGLTRARPSGFIVLDGEGAGFRPIRQPATKLALPLAAITAVAVTRVVTVSVREARRRKKLEARRCEEDAEA
ncbi:GerW family sporulation protein [Nocardiopsis kunsanensis]|uniref:Sporulation protein YtfJ n=1 Tax=Nocardiopsis kunsanensis TaxID=141693 RepID=A0A918XCZ2_9ACTN|nr:hypothetical protein [Nocardiopsis kunsanensis]GHD25428.1 hypothetical protein GCM10007147_22740 [Nocardiopsis kunsanensis]